MNAINRKPVLNDSDINMQPLLECNVVVLGYGNQGAPQAQNLRDSGVTVKIGARSNSTNRDRAEADGFEVLSFQDALEWGDVIVCLLPDEVVAEVYQTQLAPHLGPGHYLAFGHGLAIHAGWVQPDPDINVFMVAPKGQGLGVRNKYLAGSGVPGLYAVHQDHTGDTEEIALAYAKAIGCARVGVMPTTFKEETVSDLFSEQAVLCGGLTGLIKTAFETLVESGFSPEVAYFECLYEVKLIADLLHERGITGMREAISSTALYGDLSRGGRIIDEHVRNNMRQVMGEILSGQFAREMRDEFAQGKPMIQDRLAQDARHAIEQTHRDLHARLHFN